MDAATALLQHLQAVVRNEGGDTAATSFECAASQLQLLGAASVRHAAVAELAGELLERAVTMVGSKQVGWVLPAGCQGARVAATAAAAAATAMAAAAKRQQFTALPLCPIDRLAGLLPAPGPAPAS